MSCCGKAGRILQGHVANALGAKSALAKKRLAVCRTCPDVTWLTILEYLRWQIDHRRLRDLPQRPPHDQAGMFCRRCGCYLPAKARLLKETCERDQWKGID